MPECQNIEYKALWKDEYLKQICGFANACGGSIHIGCDNDGDVIGLEDAKHLLEALPNKIRDNLGIIADVNLKSIDDRYYIEINTPPYQIGVSYKGVYYYRSGSTLQALTGPALESFLMKKRGLTWDNLPLPAFSLSDIDDGAVNLFKKMAAKTGRINRGLLDESNDILLEKLHLKNGDYLTNGAMLLFSKDPEKWQLGAFVKIGFFETNADLLYQDEVHGSLFEQINKIIETLNLKYMKAKISYEGFQREENYFVPNDALREALLNALCHKQYQTGIPIQVSVHKNELFIYNPGALPENWTSANLMQKHASRPYNPSIAHAFYLAGLIESWGRGIEKICASCLAQNMPTPTFEITPGDIMIGFSASNDWSSGDCATKKGVTENVPDVTENVPDVTENVPDVTENVTDVTENVTENVTVTGSDILNGVIENLDTINQSIISVIYENPENTALQIAEKLSLSTRTIRRRLKFLKETGLIKRVGSDRKGFWKIIKTLE